MARRALVTGAARGIGRAIALHLAGMGLDVAVHYRRSRETAEATAREVERWGRRALLVAGDVTDPKEAAAIVEAAVKGLGGLEVLVHNVGDYLYKPLERVGPEEWRAILDSNLNSAFYLLKAAWPHLEAAGVLGRVVFLGYAGAGQLTAKPQITPYFVAKTGVVLLAKAAAKRLAPTGVTVNVVAPGVAENSVSKPLREIPMGRLAALDEVARAVAFFVDEESGYLTGQVIEVAGGWNL